MSTHIRHVALVSESARAKMSDLLRVSAALQKQASRDLAPIWEISATVDAFEKLEQVPDGYWPMIVKDDIDVSGAAGVHMDKDNQPFALISAADKLDQWSLTASHEMCEMLVDPSGDRQITSDPPENWTGKGRASFLVEVCDPSEAADFAYSVNGILVSDFYTPHYFDPVKVAGTRYSFTGAITEPRQVLKGGYLSWKDAVGGHWWQEVWFDTPKPTFRDIGPADSKRGSLRSFVDSVTAKDTAKAISRGRGKAGYAGLTAAQGDVSSEGTAKMWRQEIASIMRYVSKRAKKKR